MAKRGIWPKRDRAIEDCRLAIDAHLDAHPCERCGWDGPRAAKELHHRNPATKIDSPKRMCGQQRIKAAMIELEKCQVLCAICHKLVHAEIDGRL